MVFFSQQNFVHISVYNSVQLITPSKDEGKQVQSLVIILQVSDHIHVIFVRRSLHDKTSLLRTIVYTLGINHTSVSCVPMRRQMVQRSENICASIQTNGLTSKNVKSSYKYRMSPTSTTSFFIGFSVVGGWARKMKVENRRMMANKIFFII